MLDNFIYSVNVILPIFIIVILGFVLGRTKFLGEGFIEPAEKIVFKVALPVMLFLEVAGAEKLSGGDLKLIAYCIVSVTSVFILMSLGAFLFVKKEHRGAFVQGSSRSNFAVLGIPLAISMFGDAGATAIALVMPFVIVMFNAYSVIVLSIFSCDEKKVSFKETLKRLLLNIVTNPLIIAVVLALPVLYFEIDLPTFADRSLNYISGMTTPLSLICLGANFKLSAVKGRAGAAAAATALKLVIVPLVTVGIAALLGFRNEALGTVFILFGAPSAVSSYIMAKNMKNDSDLAAEILLFTTMVCVFTVFGGVFLLKTLALI
ncbi:MAG: AEC family transporter [Ruminococcaceae bacterium]|nr:AEC family transporter [Oscillospiraceae bacterium]